jgi:hypothetical protein
MVNKHELIKNDKFLVAALLLAVGVVEWGATYLIYKNPKLEPDIQQRRSKDVSSCSRFAKDLGYQVSTKSRSGIEITNVPQRKAISVGVCEYGASFVLLGYW